jgi:hypothetical protein
MERIDELIDMFSKADCPKQYKNCPLAVVGNDCDNYCPFVEVVDLLNELKEKRQEVTNLKEKIANT